MNVEYGLVFAYIIGIILLFLLGRLLLVPMKILLKLIYNALLGGVLLLIINFIGDKAGFHLPFNIISALIVGFLGIPGVILIFVLKVLFNSP